MNAVAFILACGQGGHLGVLSQKRVRPAVPFGGKYRVIDFTLSNCANSDIRWIGILTQYRPRSLNDHIGTGRPWDLDRTFSARMTLLPAYQGVAASPGWYRGTADAVFRNLEFGRDADAQTALVLSGDHVYQMDYNPLLRYHHETQADVTVCVVDIPQTSISQFQLLPDREDASVHRFWEKPHASSRAVAQAGIYVFRLDVLARRLAEDARLLDSTHDFANDVLPRMLQLGDRVRTWHFGAYCRRIATVHTYWQANMELLAPAPPLNLIDPDWPIQTRDEERPPANILPCATVSNSLVTDGCVIEGQVQGSVLSPGVRVRPGAVVRDSIIFHDCEIGSKATLDRAVLDKNVMVGPDVRLGLGVGAIHPSRIRSTGLNSGITVIGKNTCLPSGVQVGRDCLVGSDLAEDDFAGCPVSDGQCIGFQPSVAEVEPAHATHRQPESIRGDDQRRGKTLTKMLSRARQDSTSSRAWLEAQEGIQDVPATR